MIDEDAARLHGAEGTVLADRHLPEIVVISDAGKDEIGILGGRGRRRRRGALVLGHPF